MEAFDERLKRFLLGSPNEIFLTILNSFHNFTVPEIKRASGGGLHNLALMGVHAVAQTISEHIYGKRGPEATTFYFRNFIDEPSDTARFADIAIELHGFRNVHAHQWSSRLNHFLAIDTDVMDGWRRDGSQIRFNPGEVISRFGRGFGDGKPIWQRHRNLDPIVQLRRKYRYLWHWLELADDHPVRAQIETLVASPDLTSFENQEPSAHQSIANQLGVSLT